MLKVSDFKGAGAQSAPEEKRMKIQILRQTVAAGQPVVEGQTVEVPDAEARFLISIGKAQAVEAVKNSEIETADAPMEHVETADLKAPRKRK